MKRNHTHSILSLLFLICLFSSCKTVKMKEADEKFRLGEYFEAANMYRSIYKKTPTKNKELRGEISYKMGESYRLINNTARANAAYTNAARFLPHDSLIALQYARTLHKMGNYPQAEKEYERFLKAFPDNKFAQNGLKGAKMAQQMKANPVRCTVKKSDLFNSRRSDFAPMLLPPDYDNLYFTTMRDEALGETKSNITGMKSSDIFMARKDEKGAWMKPNTVEALNTEFDEGIPSFSSTGSTLYYTYCATDPEKPMSAAIYVSQRSGGAWNKGTKLEIAKKDTVSVFAHPAINTTGDYLYFVSDMPGGFGGKDIWRAYLHGDEVDYVENLGADINTAGDEMFPYMRNDSVLYFSSDGQMGMGGLDIFKATLDAKLKRWSLTNVGSPINSQGDDFGITFAGVNENGFFSSNRNEAAGYDRIYSFEYPSVKIILEGYVVNTNDDFIPGATVYVVGDDGVNEKVTSRQDGVYRLPVSHGRKYVLLGGAEGFLNSKRTLNTVNLERDTVYYVDFVLQSVQDPGLLSNILYDFDKAALRDESKRELDSLIGIMELNPHITIELSAHTDRKGSDEYNKKLSERRAQSVVDYLIANGIEKDRLQAQGYGKSKPVLITKTMVNQFDFLKENDVLTPEFVNTLTPEQQEIADQINRRTEFHVLTTDYK